MFDRRERIKKTDVKNKKEKRYQSVHTSKSLLGKKVGEACVNMWRNGTGSILELVFWNLEPGTWIGTRGRAWQRG